MHSLAAQPAALGLLAVLSQFRPGAEAAIDFFLVVIAIWLGMNNAVRDLVRDRKVYVRERLAGLSPEGYYFSRCLEHATVGAAQIAILLLTTFFSGWIFLNPETQLGLYDNTGILWLFIVLEATLLGGVGLGLLVSANVDTEEAAVATLPLLVMPQLLLSSLATGQADYGYSEPRPFRPLISVVTEWGTYDSWGARLVDWLSLICLSRPAALLAESPQPWVWLGDACHFVILLSATWAAAYYCFILREIDWRRARFGGG